MTCGSPAESGLFANDCAANRKNGNGTTYKDEWDPMKSKIYFTFRHFFLLAMLFTGISGHVYPQALITLERVHVFASAEEAAAEGLGFLPVEVRWSLDASVPGNYIVRINKYIDDEVRYQDIATQRVDFSDRNNWGDPMGRPDQRSEGYRLDLLDGTGEAISSTENHYTIFLHDLTTSAINQCAGSVGLQWDNYRVTTSAGIETELPPFFTHHLVLVLPPVGSEYVADTLSFTDTDYDYQFAAGSGTYRFRVQSVQIEQATGNLLRYSNSNTRTIDFARPVITDIDIQYADIVDNRDILVGFSVTGNMPEDIHEFEYEVFRSSSPSGPFIPAGSGISDPATGEFVLADIAVPGLESGPVYYKVAALLAGCSDDYEIESDVVSSLFLQGEIGVFDDTQLIIDLSWTQDPAMPDFELFRMLPGETEWQFISTSSSMELQDDLSSLAETLAGEVRYRLQATDGIVMVHSNEISVIVETGLVIPNAFRPGSSFDENQHFRPGFTGQIPGFYRLTIYNRWGQEIFSITDPGNDWPGWNGKDPEGTDVQQGVYGYRFEYQIGNGPREEIMGTVMLIR